MRPEKASQRPSTTSARRIGRASTACNVPESISLEMAPTVRNRATKLDKKWTAYRPRTVRTELAVATWVGGAGAPRVNGGALVKTNENPSAYRPTNSRLSTDAARISFRLIASWIVKRAIVRAWSLIPSSFGALHQAHEHLLERAAGRDQAVKCDPLAD